MNAKLLIIFLLLVCIPLIMVSGFSIRFMHDQHGINRMREQALIAQQLAAIDDAVQTQMKQHERTLISEKMPDLNPWVLRQLVRRHASIRQLIVLDAKGQRLFPPSSSLSQAEADFLQRTALFRQDMGEKRIKPIRSRRNRPLEQIQPAPIQSMIEPRLSSRGTGVPSAERAQHNLGWRVWYWAEGIHLMYVWQDARGYRLGAEVSRIKLLSDIVAKLPVTNDPRYLVAIRDASRKVVYQWGGYPAHHQGVYEKPVSVRALSYPLSAWSLAYYQPTQASNPIWVWSPLLVSLMFGVLLVLGLAVVFYRESVREFRDAQQRVTFVNQVSHELKTPLTNIRMYAELLEHSLDDEDPRQKQKLQVIIAEAQRLSRMIANVLTFARQARHKLLYQPGLWVLDEVVNDVVQQFELAFQAKGIQLRCQCRTHQSARFDRDIVEQVLGNLLNNVEKYAPNSGLVVVSTEPRHTLFLLSVRDQGPGVAKSMRARLFEPFTRGNDRLTEGVSGTGIGLSIARDLARLHGGDLVLLDEDGPGATFQASFMHEGVL